MSRHSNRRRTPAGPSRRGFTLVELLIVFVILAILIALLLPAINGAVRTAKNAAVTANLKQLDAALAAFKAKYGEYPPSRIVLWEDGFFRTTGGPTTLAGAAPWSDMSREQLAQRSLAAMRKLFPKVVFSTSGAVWGASDSQWYDFNGDGKRGGIDPSTGQPNFATPIILQGHQCLTFFLGGLPQVTAEGFAMTGFAKNPANPFTPAIPPSGFPNFVSQNREVPLFEFDSSRLVADTINPYGSASGIPGYIDTLGNTSVDSGQINFIAYFSAYGNNAYDPNDVNFAKEADEAFPPVSPILASFNVRFPVSTSNSTTAQYAASPAPNPYCSTATTAVVVNFVNPQTYQLISSGVDGLYGPGGQFNPNAAAGVLPYSSTTTNSTDSRVRQREQDNLTNFRGGRLD